MTNYCEECSAQGFVAIATRRRWWHVIAPPPYKLVICPNCDGTGVAEDND